MDSNVVEMSRHVSADFQKTGHELVNLWKEIGIAGEDIVDRLNKLRDHLRRLLGDSLAGEVEMRDRLLKNIEEYDAELAVLTRELQIDAAKPDKTLSILEREELLRGQVHELTTLKVSRRRKLKGLRAQERHLCTRLAMPPHQLDTRVPSEGDLHELEKHVQMLKEEQARRETKYHDLRAEVLALVEELSVAPESSFQEKVVTSDPASFELSTSSLAAVAAYLEELKSLHAARVAECAQLRQSISQFWNRLDVPQDQQEAFTSEHTGLGEDVVAALKSEVARCEVLKRERLQEFIQRVIAELLDMYTKCGVPERKARLEGACEAEACTEERLQSLEAELTAAKRFYDEHTAILEKVERREVLWGRLLEFETKARDPGRFNNRGGGLLLEERERKRLEKELPRLGREILEHIEAHEADGSSLFLEWSAAFKEHLEAQYASYQEDKENERLAREARRNMSGSSRSAKRGTSPAAHPSKMARMATASLTSLRPGTSALASPRSAVKRGKVVAARRRSIRRAAKETPSGASSTARRQPGDSTFSTSAASLVSYRGFTAGLNSEKRRPSTRSTLLPSTEPWKSSFKCERTLSVAKAGRRLQF